MDHDNGTVFAGEIHFHVVDLHNTDLAAAQRFPPDGHLPEDIVESIHRNTNIHDVMVVQM